MAIMFGTKKVQGNYSYTKPQFYIDEKGHLKVKDCPEAKFKRTENDHVTVKVG